MCAGAGAVRASLVPPRYPRGARTSLKAPARLLSRTPLYSRLLGLTLARCPLSLLALLGLYLQTLGLAGLAGSAPTIFYIIFFYLFLSNFFAVFSFFVNIFALALQTNW